MISSRITLSGLLALAALSAAPVTGQDFFEHYAAYQGRPAPQSANGQRSRSVRPANYTQGPATEVAVQTDALPPPAASSRVVQGAPQGRTLSNIYSAPVHSPDYNAPWTTSNCASCGHSPTFEPGSDVLGTCGYGGSCSSCGPSCGECGGCGPCGACGGAGGGCDWGPLCCNTLVWARFDVLLWWRQGRDYPALITTDPTTESSTTAGILPDAQILFGDSRVASTMRAGGRVDFGFFVDPRQCAGYGLRFYGLGQDDSNFRVASSDEPVLAIPFRDIAAGANDALLVAYPGLRSGEISVSGTSSVLGNDVYGRYLLCRDNICRLDFLTGWHYARVADQVQMNSSSTVTEIGGNIPVGTVSSTVDSFKAYNTFNGAILGLEWQRDCGVWQSRVLGRMSLGNMHEVVEISGSSSVTVPNQTPVTSNGGVLTAGSNIGRRSRDEFTAITEVGYTLAYRFAPCTQLTVGYSFIYFSDIVTAGSAIDPTIGTAGGTARPEFRFRHSDFWVQGINLGLTKQF